ncbi:hypothetical protein T552_02302 [Pneumocystis carinii B80]|uniref:Uncharacterized protein n=1 Tax=Pneumocystis carinii (strain B80) TaxID=1408658 RepID=A0A0W4ZG21_PNEC8|nr:hypothetical protein T552_02302 [Pneumocystis carinii B80]KTW27318.1 hypothetical protein T552_02302 [Pneumocystis carinii B80]
MKRILFILKNGSVKENINIIESDIIKIVEKLCIIIRPINEMRQFDALETVSKDIQQAYYTLVGICLQCIDILITLFIFLMENSKINSKIIQALAIYQIKSDPWTSIENYSLSSKILEDIMKRISLEEILVHILMNDIRPYFSSQSNRLNYDKNMQIKTKKPLRRPYENISGLSGVFRAELWKTEGIECTSILEWIIFVCQKDTAMNYIYLIISFLVTLFEDADPNFKLKGSRCLYHLLSKCDAAFIKKTGMGDLFWELVIQCLSYHPPSIDISISIPLLRTSFNNLITLASLMHLDHKDKRVKLYDEIVYNGIFNGMLYSGEQSDMVILLMEYIEKLVNIMGIYAVKHIEMLISLVSSVLEKSFQTNHPQRFLEAAKALKAIIHICWPRIEYHHATILQGICFCWLNIHSQKGKIIDDLKKQLHLCMKSLKKLMGNKLDNDIKALMDVDSNLALFFKDI